MARLAILLSTFMINTAFAFTSCPQALSSSDEAFCPSFKSVATCHCMASGLPKSLCSDVNTVYKRMIALFGSVERACAYQHDTDQQTCIDDWTCYREGGKNSNGQLCSNTGSACSNT